MAFAGGPAESPMGELCASDAPLSNGRQRGRAPSSSTFILMAFDCCEKRISFVRLCVYVCDEVQQEAVRKVCGALGMREQFEAAMAAGELLEMLESLPRGAVEASVRQMRGYNRTGEWPEPILTSPAPQRGRSPSPVDEWSDG